MKITKLLIHDITCDRCHRAVNRAKAEAEDWTEVHYVDRTGMAITRAYLCQHCQEHLDDIDLYKEPTRASSGWD